MTPAYGGPEAPLGGGDSFLDDSANTAVDKLLLDPPDPVDLLIAHASHDASDGARPLDFVRGKFQDLKKENARLRERVSDLEQTLSIVQTAQEWAMGKGMTPEQAEKMREIKALLEQAKRAREEIQHFSSNSKTTLYEKLRTCKIALKKEREEKRDMKDRLMQVFEHTREVKRQHQELTQQRTEEHERWHEVVRDMKDRHRRELRRLQGDGAAMEADRQDQLSHFGEQVIGELGNLQQHVRRVREETVDLVDPAGEEVPDDYGASATGGDFGGDFGDLGDDAGDGAGFPDDGDDIF